MSVEYEICDSKLYLTALCLFIYQERNCSADNVQCNIPFDVQLTLIPLGLQSDQEKSHFFN